MRQVDLPAMENGMVEVRTLFSGISRGTERLVSRGLVPASEHQRMRAPFQKGDFPFPVKYGYAATGVVEDGPDTLIGREVFVLHPHQARFRVPAEWAVPLPDGVPAARAILGANAETALNAIWDADPAPGARVLVVGAGLVGALVAMLLGSMGGLEVSVVDKVEERGSLFTDFPVTFRRSSDETGEHDIVIHTTATAAGLDLSLNALAFEGTCIELSWYGETPVPVQLGGAFHAKRLTLRSSQVGHVSPKRRGEVSHRERLARALGHLSDPRFDRLITEDVAFTDLPAAIPRLLADDAPGIATRVVY